MENNTDHKSEDVFVKGLHTIITYCVKALALMMIVVIIASVVDVAYIMYDKIIKTLPVGVLHIEHILTVLGAFIAVLIAIEVFNNIIVYLKADTVHIKLVLSTALIAISRKVIILDYANIAPTYIFATAALVVATAIAYWIVTPKTNTP